MPTFTAVPRFVSPEGLLNQVNDAMPGGTQNSVAGIQVARDPGQLGVYAYLTAADALQRYGNVLLSGLYQYVQVDSGSATPAQGVVATFATLAKMESYIVTASPTAASQSFFAGIFLNAITPGNFGWIQVAGIATVQYKSTVGGTPAIGDIVAQDSTPTNTVVDFAQGTAQLPSAAKLNIGTALTLPANSALGQVLLRVSDWTF